MTKYENIKQKRRNEVVGKILNKEERGMLLNSLAAEVWKQYENSSQECITQTINQTISLINWENNSKLN